MKESKDKGELQSTKTGVSILSNQSQYDETWNAKFVASVNSFISWYFKESRLIRQKKGRTSTTNKRPHMGALIAKNARSMLIAKQVNELKEIGNLLPLRIYISSDSTQDLDLVEKHYKNLLRIINVEIIENGVARKGSWLRELIGKWKNDPYDFRETVLTIEKATELRLINKAQAGIDKTQAEAVALLINSLDNIEEAILQIGSLAIVKRQNSNNEPCIAVLSLSPTQLATLEESPSLLKEPQKFFEKFSSSTRLNEEELHAENDSANKTLQPTPKSGATEL